MALKLVCLAGRKLAYAELARAMPAELRSYLTHENPPYPPNPRPRHALSL